MVILTMVALIVALIGYDLIHKAEQWLTYVMIAVFGIFTITLFFSHYPAGTFDVGDRGRGGGTRGSRAAARMTATLAA